MADNFGGQGFATARGSVQRSREAAVSVRHMPGGDVTFVDAAGREAGQLGLTALCATAAAYNALEGLVGQRGVLALGSATYMATLLACELAGTEPDGYCAAALRFVLG